MLYAGAALGIATLSPPPVLRVILAGSASMLAEATPFFFAGFLLARLLRRRHDAIAFFGCGCSSGPSARSLPTAAATWLTFGPIVAAARLAAALLVARVLRRREAALHDHAAREINVLGELRSMLPAALLAGVAAPALAQFEPARFSILGNALVGALFGFVAAPCGLGAVALASMLRSHAPIAAAAFLCVAGIVDVRALRALHERARVDHDALAYALLAIALAIVAAHHGDALVHPAFTLPLWICAAGALICAVVYARRQSPAVRFGPALILIGALVGAPPPEYHATETTLSDLFAGERLRFAGMLTCDSGSCALVRYAITCCRADAAAIVVRLDRMLPQRAGTWLRVNGRLDEIAGVLRLVPDRVERISPPTDPFVYR